MAETLYLTPTGTPPLSPAQAPRKRKSLPVNNSNDYHEPSLSNAKAPKSSPPSHIPPSRQPKTKQTKSRNGCHTCKAKRLKCDETKPTCKNCVRRNVTCEGYKKEFKWRGFQESNVGRKLTRGPDEEISLTNQPPTASIDTQLQIASATFLPKRSRDSNFDGDLVPITNSGLLSPVNATTQEPANTNSLPLNSSFDIVTGLESPKKRALPAHEANIGPNFVQNYGNDALVDSILGQQNAQHLPSPASQTNSLVVQSKGSIQDSSEELNSFGPDHHCWMSAAARNSGLDPDEIATSPVSNVLSSQIHFDVSSPEMLIQRFFASTCSIMSIFPVDTMTSPQSNPWQSLIWPMVFTGPFPMLYHSILSMACFHGSQEEPSLRQEGMMHMRTSLDLLQKDQAWLSLPIEITLATCISLAFSESWMCWNTSIKSGAGYVRNAKQCIMHALMNGAQTRTQKRQLRFLCKTYLYIDVIARLTSVDSDVSNDAFDNIATKVLGIHSEGRPCTGPMRPDHHALLDINPGNTSLSSDFTIDVPRIDSLMGAASTLFPIIGRVANLVRRISISPSSTPSIISTAVTLKQQLEFWPSTLSAYHDLTPLQEDAMHTAEAYRLATLLHLYQSIPELVPAHQSPRALSTNLGTRVLNNLARIPINSTTLIVHIYPLLVGGCEAIDLEDRSWVRQRWMTMVRRMGIGNVEKAKEVVEEVWRRRDDAAVLANHSMGSGASEAALSIDFDTNYGGCDLRQNANDEFSFDDAFDSIGSAIDFEGDPAMLENAFGLFVNDEDTPAISDSPPTDFDYTVKGRLHWVGVMKEWGWEILLG